MRVVLVVLVSLVGCRPKDGRWCNTTYAAVCADARTMLRCENARWQAIDCGGAAGCVEGSEHIECDASVAREGAACLPAFERACSTDGRALLRCSGSTWARDGDCARCVVTKEAVECHSDS